MKTIAHALTSEPALTACYCAILALCALILIGE